MGPRRIQVLDPGDLGISGVLGQFSPVSTPDLALYLRIGLLSQVGLTQAFFLLVGAKLHIAAGPWTTALAHFVGAASRFLAPLAGLSGKPILGLELISLQKPDPQVQGWALLPAPRAEAQPSTSPL